MVERTIDVSHFAVNPTDGVHYLWRLIAVAVAPGQVHRLVQCGKRPGDLALVCARETQEIKAEHHHEPVTKFQAKTMGADQHFFSLLILRPEEVEQPARA